MRFPIHRHDLFIPIMLAGCLCAVQSLRAAGIHDEGLQTAVVRTDYNETDLGLAHNPLSFITPCLFPDSPCGNGPNSYSSSHAWSQNGSFSSPRYWVLSLNNEIPAYDYHLPVGAPMVFSRNPGPPNQSLPRSEPGHGVMGFKMVKDTPQGEDFWRAALVLNAFFPNPNPDPIPYLGLSADRDRGNGDVIAWLGNYFWLKHRVQFTAKLWDFALPDYAPTGGKDTGPLIFWFFATARWNNQNHGLFISLLHWNIEFSMAPDVPGRNARWNWPIQESMYHPGADIAYMDAEDTAYFCNTEIPRLNVIGQEIDYDIDLNQLFRCASEHNLFQTPMPTQGAAIPVNHIEWSNELAGTNGALFTSVHNMRIR